MKIKIIAIILSVLLVLTAVLGALLFSMRSGFTPLEGGPGTNDTVINNGGLVVRKGNYLFFTNGFLKDNLNLLDQDANNYNNTDFTSIYRAPLDSSGELERDQDNNIINAEIVVPKIVGFENGGFYIYDGKIFYSSPSVLRDEGGNRTFSELDFFSVNIDGSRNRKIYTTDGYSKDSGSFSIIKKNNDVHIILYTGSDLINITTNNGRRKSVDFISNNVSSLVYSNIKNFNPLTYELKEINKYIYYTRTLDSEKDDENIQAGNVLAKYKLGSNKEIVLVKDNKWEYTLNEIRNEHLYYTKKSSNSLNSKLYKATILADNTIGTENDIQLSYSSLTTYIIPNKIENEPNRVIANIDNKLVMIYSVFDDEGIEILKESTVKPLFEHDDYIYYTIGSENRVYKLNLETLEETALTATTDRFSMPSGFNYEFDGEYIYMLIQIEDEDENENHYLSRISINEKNQSAEIIGNILEDHMPKE